MSDRCIGERWLVDPDSNTGISTRHLNTKQIKDFDAVNFKSVIVIRESDITSLFDTLFPKCKCYETERGEPCDRCFFLSKFIPPKESEAGE